jgi:hypothetical protein
MTTIETTTVVIADEGTRRMLETVLWVYQGHVLELGSERLDEQMFSVSQAVLGELSYGPREVIVPEIDAKLATVASVRSEIDRLRSTDLGAAFVLSVPSEEIVSALRGWVIPTVEEDERFWGLPRDLQVQLLTVRDAAVRLLGELPQPAEVA